MLFDRRRDEGREKRVRLAWLRLKFRMRLRPDKPRVILQLDDLHEIPPGIHATDDHARLLELRDVVIVHLVTMAMPFAYLLSTVSFVRERAGRESAIVAAESHRRALVHNLLLFLHHVDHGMGRPRI